MSAVAKKPPSWHPLPLTTNIRLAPSLLVKTSFTSNSYTVHITDLVQVWSEDLDCSGILSRAAKASTTIDPAEDASQLSLLLEKLEGGLGGGSDLSELVLSCIPRRGISGSDGVGILKLRLAIELPLPLPELEWTFRLHLGTQVDFTNLFVMPLISMAGLQAAQVKSLKTVIKEKDQVIDKMKDALEDNKVRVDIIVGPRRRKALAPFDEVAWDRNLRGDGVHSGAEVVRSVYASGECAEGALVQAFKQQAAEWWKGVFDDETDDDDDGDDEGTGGKPTGTIARRGSSVSPPVVVEEEPRETPETKRQEPVPEMGSETDSGGDGFEPLKTPPPPAARERHSKKKAESDSEDELPPPCPPPQTPIGKVGGKRKAKPLTPQPPTPLLARQVKRETPPDVTMADAGEETTDDEENLDAGVVRWQSPQPLPPAPPKATMEEDPPATKRGLSRIGGRKPQHSPPAPQLSATAAGSGRDKQPLQKQDPHPAVPVTGVGGGVKKSLGRIGGKSKAKLEIGLEDDADNSAVAAGTSSIPSPLAAPKMKSPSPEPEDEDKKADRKRRELLMELEAKKKAPPKKKRKF